MNHGERVGAAAERIDRFLREENLTPEEAISALVLLLVPQAIQKGMTEEQLIDLLKKGYQLLMAIRRGAGR